VCIYNAYIPDQLRDRFRSKGGKLNHKAEHGTRLCLCASNLVPRSRLRFSAPRCSSKRKKSRREKEKGRVRKKERRGNNIYNHFLNFPKTKRNNYLPELRSLRDQGFRSENLRLLFYLLNQLSFLSSRLLVRFSLFLSMLEELLFFFLFNFIP
jgi:hypothetical protein